MCKRRPKSVLLALPGLLARSLGNLYEVCARTLGPRTVQAFKVKLEAVGRDRLLAAWADPVLRLRQACVPGRRRELIV